MTPKNLMQFGWSSCAHSRTSFCSSGRSFAPSLAFPICLATASRPSSLQLKTVPKPPSPSLEAEEEVLSTRRQRLGAWRHLLCA